MKKSLNLSRSLHRIMIRSLPLPMQVWWSVFIPPMVRSRGIVFVSGKWDFQAIFLEDAFEYYNSIVSKQQRLIERTFDRIFRNWYEVANPSMDFSVQPLKYIRNAAVSDNNA